MPSPNDKGPLLVVLDLDEFLIHSKGFNPHDEYDFIISMSDDDPTPLYSTLIRDGVGEFLDFLFEDEAFVVGVWTSATADYARVVLDNVFGPDREPLFVFSRERCVRSWMPSSNPYGMSCEMVLIKDLKKVKRATGFDYSRIIAIDDYAPYYQRQYSNLVSVPEFKGQKERPLFPHLMRYLKRLSQLDNVRKIDKRGWLTRYRTGDFDVPEPG